jgi:hypothetical protein
MRWNFSEPRNVRASAGMSGQTINVDCGSIVN